ncbi:MAG: LPP20 family lipoprotein [Flavobacteriales bacterium]|jgi:hypothetical protein
MSSLFKYTSIFLGFALAALLNACGNTSGTSSTTKPVITQEPKPAWVEQRPVNSAFYIGVGSCSKRTQPLDYQTIAKKNALNDLASEISVRVQGSTFLNALEVNKTFSEEFISNITTTTDEKIEDYEVAGIWEDQNDYHIYYRLNKAAYQQKKMMKKNQAMSSAFDFYSKGKEAERTNAVPAAIDNYLRGLFAIQDYWGEINEYNAEQGKIFLDNEIYSSLQRLASGLTIVSSQPRFTLAAENSYTVNSSLMVTYNGQPVRGITTTHAYPKTRFMKSRVEVTDETGRFGVIIDNVNPQDKDLSLNVEIDLMPLQPNDLDRRITGPILKNLRTDSKKFPIEFIAPSFSVSSTENVYGATGTTTSLASATTAELIKKGLRQISNNPDYRIKINSNSTDGGSSQGFVVALLELTVIVESNQGEIIYKESLNNIKGLQLNRDAASIEAYKKGRERLEQQIIPSILDTIF